FAKWSEVTETVAALFLAEASELGGRQGADELEIVEHASELIHGERTQFLVLVLVVLLDAIEIRDHKIRRTVVMNEMLAHPFEVGVLAGSAGDGGLDRFGEMANDLVVGQ